MVVAVKVIASSPTGAPMSARPADNSRRRGKQPTVDDHDNRQRGSHSPAISGWGARAKGLLQIKVGKYAVYQDQNLLTFGIQILPFSNRPHDRQSHCPELLVDGTRP